MFGLVIALCAGGLVIGVAILLLPKPSINIAVSGALNGQLHLSDPLGRGISCSKTTAGGIREWNGDFPVVLNGHDAFFSVGVTDYHGAGRYVDAPINDVRILTRHPYGRTRDTSVHANLSLGPPGRQEAIGYGSDPDPSTFGSAPSQASPYGPVGQGSVAINPNEKSGQIDAVLMNTRALDSEPVRVVGSFMCTRLENGPPEGTPQHLARTAS